MALLKGKCKIYLTHKLNKQGNWEYRLSIREEVLGAMEEVLFASGELEQEFIDDLENKLIDHNLKDYTKIQRVSRWSRTLQKLLSGRGDNMKKVPQYIFERVRNILLEARKNNSKKELAFT